MNRMMRLLMGGVMAVAAVFPALAQGTLSADESLLLEIVQDAFEAVLAEESYHVTGDQRLAQTLTYTREDSDYTLNQSFEQMLEGWIVRQGEAGRAVQITMTASVEYGYAGQTPVQGGQVVEVIVIDDTLYMRVSEVTPPQAGANIPPGWVNLSEEPDAIPGTSLINTDQYSRLLSTYVNYPLTSEAVLAITELAPERVEEVEMRVLEIVFDVPTLLRSGQFDLMLSAFNVEDYGTELDTLLALMGENAAVTMQVWLTPEHTLYRTDSRLSLSAPLEETAPNIEQAAMTQEVTASLVYSDFGQPFDITAPEVGSTD